MDLLRACQREGVVRLERDRRGGLRVFQGAVLVRGVMPVVGHADPGAGGDEMSPADDEASFASASVSEIVSVSELGEDAESDGMDSPPMAVVDTTAELLGRAKPRRPRTRAAGSVHSSTTSGTHATRGARRTPPKGAAPARRARSKKTAAGKADDTGS